MLHIVLETSNGHPQTVHHVTMNEQEASELTTTLWAYELDTEPDDEDLSDLIEETMYSGDGTEYHRLPFEFDNDADAIQLACQLAHFLARKSASENGINAYTKHHAEFAAYNSLLAAWTLQNSLDVGLPELNYIEEKLKAAARDIEIALDAVEEAIEVEIKRLTAARS